MFFFFVATILAVSDLSKAITYLLLTSHVLPTIAQQKLLLFCFCSMSSCTWCSTQISTISRLVSSSIHGTLWIQCSILVDNDDTPFNDTYTRTNIHSPLSINVEMCEQQRQKAKTARRLGKRERVEHDAICLFCIKVKTRKSYANVQTTQVAGIICALHTHAASNTRISSCSHQQHVQPVHCVHAMSTFIYINIGYINVTA